MNILRAIVSISFVIVLHATQLKNDLNCAEEVSKKISALSLKAAIQQEEFIEQLKMCREQNSDACQTGMFIVRTLLLANTRNSLKKYTEKLDSGQNEGCEVCDKNEVQTIEGNLYALLQTPEAQHVLHGVKEIINDL
jgi:hypothetical protein